MIRYLFSINAGRSGSHYLSNLLECVKDVESYHEPDPRMQRKELAAFNNGKEKPLRAIWPEKLAIMKEVVARGKVYSETNNAFVKGFGYFVAEDLPHEEVGVIVLKRDLDQTVDSLYERGFWPHTKQGAKWMVAPDAKTNVTKPPKGADDRALVRWYVEEIYARGDRFRQQYLKMTYFDVTLDELNDYDTVVRMLSTFGLEPLDSLRELVGKPTNTRENPFNEPQ